MALAAKNGTIVHTAVAPAAQIDTKLPLFELTPFQKTLKGCLFGSANLHRDIPLLLNLYQDGKLLLDELVTNRYTLDQVNEGYEAMYNGQNIRGLITFD